MDNFTFGRCKYCGKDKALKDDICSDCADKELPFPFEDLFGGFKDANPDS